MLPPLLLVILGRAPPPLQPPSPTCEVREELGQQDQMGRRPSCQTGLPSRIFQVRLRSPEGFRERYSAALRWPHRQEWGRGFRNLPQPSPPPPTAETPWDSCLACSSPPAELGGLRPAVGDQGVLPSNWLNVSERDAREEIKWGVSGCRGFPRPVKGAVLAWVLAPKPPAE